MTRNRSPGQSPNMLNADYFVTPKLLIGVPRLIEAKQLRIGHRHLRPLLMRRLPDPRSGSKLCVSERRRHAGDARDCQTISHYSSPLYGLGKASPRS
jgi:hypothetical protein